MGVRIAGGCCGTTPAHIESLVKNTSCLTPSPLFEKQRSLVSSYARAVELGPSPALIGERINPTGKPRLKAALRAGDMGYILNLGLSQQEAGAHILDVNAGLPEIDEAALLPRVCGELQAIIDLPLQLDTSNPAAMENALRRYNGKAMINSVSGKKESMESIFPLLKKYGGLAVFLTMDENGIPDSAEGRFKIAEKIVSAAAEYGINKKNLIFDTLAMAVSANSGAALAALRALERIRSELGCQTVLGVSNISFGLPGREALNAAFFALALERGLSAAIMNPDSAEMMRVYYSFKVLHGLDNNCAAYIANIEKYAAPAEKAFVAEAKGPDESGKNTQSRTPSELSPLKRAVVKGLKEQAAALAAELLESEEPLEVVNREIIPALDIVGVGFEEKTLYLPQLLMSAEAAQSAFEQAKNKVRQSGRAAVSKGKFVIATVRGDIHDIGKNIVKLILENYGFDVADLGRDVPPEAVVEAVKRLRAPLAGLSALMTTTVPAMDETIRLLRAEAPWVKIAVGGAVLNEEYAAVIGADFYGKDAMATVRYALKVVDELREAEPQAD
ncbi:MAG: dihydropteroate synthase, partial [Oscillospiraceae bacterium]|nr:dihydropteroate synthase [Oscillospiraceae bacterium]